MTRWLVPTTEYAGVTAYTGGIGRQFAALLPALTQRGVDVDVAVFADGELTGTAAAGGIRLVHVEGSNGMLRLRRTAQRARVVHDLAAAGDYDLVFAPEWAGLASHLPAGAPLVTNLVTGARLVGEASGLSPRDLPLGHRLPLARQVAAEARQIRRSAGVIAISAAMLERAGELFDPLPPARVVRNCIDLDAIRAAVETAAAPAAWPGSDDPVVLFLGRAERRKGIVDAFAAFADVHREHPEARLVIAGATADARFEPSHHELLALLPPTARDRVSWLGHLAPDDVVGAIARADVVVCPSRWEGFGNVALEVKAVGTPLVVTSGSGFDDFCTDGEDCQMVPPADAQRLAAAIGIALKQPGWVRTLADRARAGIDAFAPDAVAADLLDAIAELDVTRRRTPARESIESVRVDPQRQMDSRDVD